MSTAHLEALKKELESEISEKQTEIAALQERIALYESNPDFELAIMLHDKFCKWNHTDGCAWHYQIDDGVHDWSASEHRTWLKRAKKIKVVVDELSNSETDVDYCAFVVKFANSLYSF